MIKLLSWPKGTEGIFGGPIPVNLCRELGFNFRRVGIEK